MTLAEKRAVIEVLLCTAGSRRRETTWDACRSIGIPDRGPVARAADAAWHRTNDYSRSHGDVCLEAAYRLIETSPALRREWFGATR